jgi:2-polyprenyl-3-methyl-5-hydroxy-6-metoxy-1,4-benzoquinol methylase
MTAEGNDICLVCGGTSLEPLIFIPGVPMLCNRLCASEAEAANAPRGDICLIYCLDCGHVANSAFDQARVKYDGCYENTLTFSPCYRRYADETARRLICRYGLTGKRIVEIGCGSGDFLRLLCTAGNDGEGYDPSQPTGRHAAGPGSFEIIGRSFTIEDARGADLVCCRHVLEHLSDPIDLLRRLRASISAGGGGIVFFEVPNALLILDRLSIWDIIYEHVSYFTPLSLTQAFYGAGFTIRYAHSGFDDQYLWVEACVDVHTAQSVLSARPADTLYRSFSARFTERQARWRRRLDDLRREQRRTVVWGAGSKGIMFLNLLGVPVGAGIDWVVDINPRKHGHFVPLTGQRIVGPDCLLQNPPDLIIVMNPEYQSEVRSVIADLRIDCEVMNA